MTTQSSEAVGEAVGTPVEVSRVVSQPLDDVWAALMAPRGAEALLGEGGALGGKGEHWRASDGSHGVARSFHPLEQIRFSWHADEDAPATLVDLHLAQADDGGTLVTLVHDHLPADADRDALRRHWEDALGRLAAG